MLLSLDSPFFTAPSVLSNVLDSPFFIAPSLLSNALDSPFFIAPSVLSNALDSPFFIAPSVLSNALTFMVYVEANDRTIITYKMNQTCPRVMYANFTNMSVFLMYATWVPGERKNPPTCRKSLTNFMT